MKWSERRKRTAQQKANVLKDFGDCRKLLRRAFYSQRSQNQSLRSLAKEIGVSPAHLSFVIRGKRGISPHLAIKLGRLLGITGITSQYLRFWAAANHGRSVVARQLARQKLTRANPAFRRALSRWSAKQTSGGDFRR